MTGMIQGASLLRKWAHTFHFFFQSLEHPPSWELMASITFWEANPDRLLYYNYDRRRFPARHGGQTQVF
jgi:hypothetical protein